MLHEREKRRKIASERDAIRSINFLAFGLGVYMISTIGKDAIADSYLVKIEKALLMADLKMSFYKGKRERERYIEIRRELLELKSFFKSISIIDILNPFKEDIRKKGNRLRELIDILY